MSASRTWTAGGRGAGRRAGCARAKRVDVAPGWRRRSTSSGSGDPCAQPADPERSREVGAPLRHGNDLYARMLDRRMISQLRVLADASDLDAAQEAKPARRQQVVLEPGTRLLDGCGGAAAPDTSPRRTAVRSSGVTISREQAALAREHCAASPSRSVSRTTGTSTSGSTACPRSACSSTWVRNHRAFMEVLGRNLADPDGLRCCTRSARGRPGGPPTRLIKPLHLPELDALRRPDHGGRRGIAGAGGLAELRARLRSTLMAWHRNVEAALISWLRRTLPAHVALLPARLSRDVPGPEPPPVAPRLLPRRQQRHLPTAEHPLRETQAEGAASIPAPSSRALTWTSMALPR